MARKYLHSLEGIRAYAFLWVFAVHYSDGLCPLPHDGGVCKWLWCLLSQVSWVAVPIFFVLSGYLITGVLFDTRGEGRFFRTFYTRRALRVLPLYYLLLGCAAVFALLSGLRLSCVHLSYLVYLHNFVPSWPTMYRVGEHVDLGHLWSLAVEEQFYVVWPVAVFLIRGRRRLLGCCYAMILLVSVIRVLWPMTHLSYPFAYECSVTRCDALMMGAALALHRRGPMQSLERLVQPARITAIAGVAVVMVRAVWVGQALPVDHFGLAVLMPVVNLVAAAVIVLAIEPTTRLSRVCSKPWAVHMGSMSYSLYVVHEPLQPWFHGVVYMRLFRMFHHTTPALLGMMGLAFALTYAVSRVTYRFVEMPALRWKNRFRYGPARASSRGVRAETNEWVEAAGARVLAHEPLMRSAS